MNGVGRITQPADRSDHNPRSDVWDHARYIDDFLARLGLTASDFGRYRGARITENGELAVQTRNGGGNRECWSGSFSSYASPCDCPGCIISIRLPQHPCYLRDEDDELDNTYATIYFRDPVCS